ncbi:hypothetical protein RRG08_066569, partial [Elysia crispata]
ETVRVNPTDSTSYSVGALMPASLLRSVDRTLHSIGDSVRVNPTDSTSYSVGALMPASLLRSVDRTLHSIGDCASKSYG